MTANLSEAIRSGIQTGLKISLNPLTQSPLMNQTRKPFNPTEEAWKMTGESLRRAMDIEANYQNSRRSR